MIVDINESNYEEEVLNSKIPVIAEFWAPWCSSCMRAENKVEEFARLNEDNFKVVKINVDENGMLVLKHSIRSIPTFIIFNNGEVAKKYVGGIVQEDLAEFMKYRTR